MPSRSYVMAIRRASQTASDRAPRWGTGWLVRNHSPASRWKRSTRRDARARSSGGNEARILSWAAATTVPRPSSAAGPGMPARKSASASSAVMPVSRVR